MNTKTIGERTEAIVLAELLKRGEVVLLPFGDNQRYDMVIDRDGTFLRIQCKTGRLKNGVIVFYPCSTSKYVSKDYRGQIELFAVYCIELDKVYLIPVDDVSTSTCHLRVDFPKNNQYKNVLWAASYELSSCLEVPSSILG